MSAPIREPDIPPLTQAEIAAMLTAAGVEVAQDSTDFAVYMRYIRSTFSELAAPMAQAEYDAVLAVIQRNPPKAVLDAIRARAISNARDLITQMTQAELSKVAAQIAEQVAQGKGPREVARWLDAVKGLDSGRAATYSKYVAELEASGLSDAEVARRAEAMFNKLLKDRKEVIAQNEMNKAVSQVQAEQARERGDKFKVWQTVGDDRVSDVCQACEAQGPIPIDDNFTSGNSEPPNHPRCRCAVSYYSNPALTDVYKRRAEERAARTAAAKADGGDV